MTTDRCRGSVAVGLLASGLAFGVSLSFAPAANADDAFVCMEQTQQKCDDENENLGLFVKGHDAFDRGRQIGDLGEARDIALELIARKDERHGKILMKYIYMQVGLGVHRDHVQAYRWIAADLAAGTSYKRLNLERMRDLLAARMSAEELARARD